MTDDTDKPDNIVPPPPRARQRGLMVEVPKPADAPDNLSRPNSGLADMNFKMDVDLHRHFKLSAVSRNMQMRELLDASYRAWVEMYGDEHQKATLPPSRFNRNK